VALNIISENSTQGADSLTPTCIHDNDTATCGDLTGLMPQINIAAEPFKSQNPGVIINATDIYSLMRKKLLKVFFIFPHNGH